jgi:alpha-mannosidase
LPATDVVMHIVPHTHWDREWYAPFQVYRYRLVAMVDALLDLLESDSAATFLLDGQTVVLEDYLEIRPENRGRLAAQIQSGRLQVGPWYTLPDEFLVSGESLIRNLQRGRRLAQAFGRCMEVGYLPDSFGHTAQMPQVYRSFGFNHAVVWRGVPGHIRSNRFCWEAPDGTAIETIYLATSYASGADLPLDPTQLAARLGSALAAMRPFQVGGHVLIMNGNDHRTAQAGLSRAVSTVADGRVPFQVKLDTLPGYLSTLTKETLPRIAGELRSSARTHVLMGTLSTRIPLKQEYFAAQRQLERVAEPLATLSSAGGTDSVLDLAWKLLLQNAAHDTACGCGVDATHADAAQRTRNAAQIAQAVADEATQKIAAGGAGLVVWNPEPRPQAGVVAVEAPADFGPFHVRDSSGAVGATQSAEEVSSTAEVTARTVPVEHLAALLDLINDRNQGGAFINAYAISTRGDTVVGELQMGSQQTGELALDAMKDALRAAAARPGVRAVQLRLRQPLRRRVWVDVPAVPPLGWARLSLCRGAGAAPHVGATVEGRTLRNRFLEATLAPDGTWAVLDRGHGRRYPGLGRFVDGGDAGDEYNYSPPPADELVVARPRPESPQVAAAGPLVAALRVLYDLEIPEALDVSRQRRGRARVVLPIEVLTSLHHHEALLRFSVRVDNRARDHRLRVHFPVPYAVEQVFADAAFHVMARPPRPADPGGPEHALPTYPSRAFAAVSDGQHGMAILHEGLPEHEVVAEAGTAALALTLVRAVGWLSRDDLALRLGHAGPPLPTPEAQVPGAHAYNYAAYFHAGSWQQGDVPGATNRYLFAPLVAGFHPGEGDPASASGPQIDNPRVLLSALYREEERCYLRVYNCSDALQEARISLTGLPARRARQVTLAGASLRDLALEGGAVRVQLRGWEIATVECAG